MHNICADFTGLVARIANTQSLAIQIMHEDALNTPNRREYDKKLRVKSLQKG